MRTKLAFMVITGLLAGCLTSCGQHVSTPGESMAKTEAVAMAQTNGRAAPSAPPSLPTVPADRKIIYEADLRLSVQDFSGIADAVRSIASKHGGYVAQASMDGASGRRRSAQWMLRVPQANYSDLLDALEGLGELQSRSEKSQEVTSEFVDLQARIHVRQQQETRLLDHLQQRTEKLDEVLHVEKELMRVREDLERLQGQLRVLSDRVNYSTVTLNITEVERFVPSPGSAALTARLSRAWNHSWETVSRAGQSLLVLAVAAIPWLLVLGVAWLSVQLGRKYLRSRTGIHTSA